MTGDMAGNLDYERFNLHAIDRIEIVKGASSTRFMAAEPSGAVINLISEKDSKTIGHTSGSEVCSNELKRNYKQPNPKDFLYMFEKNSDRPNLQSWISAGIKTR